MNFSIQQHARSIATITSVLTVLSIGTSITESTTAPDLSNQGWSAQLGSTRIYNRVEYTNIPNTPEYRIAMRLQKRLRNKGNRVSPALSKLAAAVTQRQQLLSRSFDVKFTKGVHKDPEIWSVSAQRYPLWISANFSVTDAQFSIDEKQIIQTLNQEQVVTAEPPVHAILKSITWKEDEDDVSRADIEGVAKPGYMLDENLIAASVHKAFSTDLESIEVPLVLEQGRIINMTGEDLGDLSLWANGLSDYTGSTTARKANVNKALNDHVNNTVVMPGETFSFNSTLNGRVTQGNGWHMAKVIYNGGDLEYAPGGGICQASTTVFRAVVNAGFPVVERRAHSLYVSYYKEHGVGIDATIYPGSQDLVFMNDSKKPLLIQAYNDGYEANVNIYGTPDKRTVELEGPYFTATAPDDFRKIASNEIVWVQRVHYHEGAVREYEIGSRYRTLPQSLAREFPPEEKVYASAPLASIAD